MSYDDLMNSSITWIASDYSFENYRVTMAKMDYFNALLDSVALAGLSTLCQIVVCSLVGYGLARYNFKGRTVIMLIIIISFIIPSQVLEIPIFVVYSQMGLTGTLLAFIIPALARAMFPYLELFCFTRIFDIFQMDKFPSCIAT